MINRIKLGVVVLLAVFALVYVSEARAVDVEKKTNLTGTWAASGTWVGSGSWSETWTIKQKGKKITGSSNAGYNFKGRVKGSKINFKISAGCYPTYTGTVSNNTMSGTMECEDHSYSGTWSATKTTDAPEVSGASSAGPGE